MTLQTVKAQTPMLELNNTALEQALTCIEDALKPEHLELIRDSNIRQAGVIAFHYIFGDRGLRWLYTNHTYCFLGLISEIGKIYLKGLHREQSGSLVPYSLETSFVATVIMWLMDEVAKEKAGRLTLNGAIRVANQTMTRLELDHDDQVLVRDAIRHEHRLNCRDGFYRNGRRNLYIKQRMQRRGISAKVIPIRS